MPWKECHVMDERLRFVARLLEGEKMAALCAEFGISRKTGYKIRPLQRLRRAGTDRSQPPPAAPSQPAPGAARGANRPVKAGVSRLGCAQDPREATPAMSRDSALPRHQHGARGARSLRSGP